MYFNGGYKMSLLKTVNYLLIHKIFTSIILFNYENKLTI